MNFLSPQTHELYLLSLPAPRQRTFEAFGSFFRGSLQPLSLTRQLLSVPERPLPDGSSSDVHCVLPGRGLPQELDATRLECTCPLADCHPLFLFRAVMPPSSSHGANRTFLLSENSLLSRNKRETQQTAEKNPSPCAHSAECADSTTSASACQNIFLGWSILF